MRLDTEINFRYRGSNLSDIQRKEIIQNNKNTVNKITVLSIFPKVMKNNLKESD